METKIRHELITGSDVLYIDPDNLSTFSYTPVGLYPFGIGTWKKACCHYFLLVYNYCCRLFFRLFL